MWKKSVASKPSAWLRRNVFQDGSVYTGGGGRRRVDARILRIVPIPTLWPRPSSSPWIRLWPQFRFSAARRRTRARTSSEIGGRPGRFGYVHFFETSRRCQPITVAGVTRRWRRSSRGNRRISADKIARSGQVSFGVFASVRRSTAISCRNMSISAVLAPSPRESSVSAPKTRTSAR